MEAKELKIGNWVIFDGGFPEQVRTETFAILYKYPERIRLIEPIPLTPEILEKAGFMWSIYHQAFHKEGFPFDVNEGNEWFTLYTFKKSTHITSCLKYLHQLQNLFFALTGEELKIELL